LRTALSIFFSAFSTFRSTFFSSFFGKLTATGVPSAPTFFFFRAFSFGFFGSAS
jgi:hypothetical protein